MIASTLKIAVVCGALGVSLSASSHAQQQSQTFQLAFCNISAYSNVTVALVHKKDAEKWAVDGWYPVSDNRCTVVGTFQRDTVYYFAEQVGDQRGERARAQRQLDRCLVCPGQRPERHRPVRRPQQMVPGDRRRAVVSGGARGGEVQDDQHPGEQAADHLDFERGQVSRGGGVC